MKSAEGQIFRNPSCVIFMHSPLVFTPLVLTRMLNVCILDFAAVFEGLELSPFPYVGGAAPRNKVVRDTVYTTNELPPSKPIPFRHEMAEVGSEPSDYDLSE